MGWISKLIVLGVAGYVGVGTYGWYRAGYFDLPEVPSGAYIASFKSGLRAIVLDADVPDNVYADGPAIFRRLSAANPDRKYLGIAMDVAPWFEDAWSTCIAPTDEMRDYIAKTMPDDMKTELQGARFDALCYIDVDDGQKITRGVIYSVPNL